jgi:hypothetical protein
VPDGASQIHRGLGARSAIPKAEVQATGILRLAPRSSVLDFGPLCPNLGAPKIPSRIGALIKTEWGALQSNQWDALYPEGDFRGTPYARLSP